MLKSHWHAGPWEGRCKTAYCDYWAREEGNGIRRNYHYELYGYYGVRRDYDYSDYEEANYYSNYNQANYCSGYKYIYIW